MAVNSGYVAFVKRVLVEARKTRPEGISARAHDAGGAESTNGGANNPDTDGFKGTTSEACDRRGQAVTHIANNANRSPVKIVDDPLILNELDINQRDALGCTALYLAAEGGHVELLEALLGMPDIDVNAV